MTLEQRLTITAHEAADLLGIGYVRMLALAKAGTVPHVKLGGRFLFHRRTIETWLANESMKAVTAKGE